MLIADDEVEEPASLPVGYENQITMYSLDFEEFLWAYGYDSLSIKTSNMDNRFSTIYHQYYRKFNETPQYPKR